MLRIGQIWGYMQTDIKPFTCLNTLPAASRALETGNLYRGQASSSAKMPVAQTLFLNRTASVFFLINFYCELLFEAKNKMYYLRRGYTQKPCRAFSNSNVREIKTAAINRNCFIEIICGYFRPAVLFFTLL
jgi:hypothetical protein